MQPLTQRVLVVRLLLDGLRAAAICGVMATTAGAYAASFGCGKAQTRIERMICGDPKLSAADDELAGAYAAALARVQDRAALKQSQKAWLSRVRGLDADADRIYAEYLARIEEIRLDPGLKKSMFAEAPPPASIPGRYSETEPLCFNPKEGADEYDCSGEPVESYIDIKPGPGSAVTVTGELWFFNGHVCGPFEGKAEWVKDSLRMPHLEDEENRCVLIMRFRDDKVFTEDPGSFCKAALLCGANAGFHTVELPKLTKTREEGR